MCHEKALRYAGLVVTRKVSREVSRLAQRVEPYRLYRFLRGMQRSIPVLVST